MLTTLSYHYTMSLALHTSRQFRSIKELTELVTAVSAAPSTESEPDWLEWKREGDLCDRRWHALIAKCIAGFANRDPNVAKREAGGCAYLVIGAEPGHVGGVRPVDNATLHAGVSRFVGTTARWSPQYVNCEGQQVLVITVEPPEYGDQITAMLTAYGSHERSANVCRKGDVFLRRHGSTDFATQSDYDMLVQRFAAGAEHASGIRLQTVGVVTAVPVLCGPDEVTAWRRRQELVLLASLDQPTPNRIGSIPTPLFADTRNADEYRREVASYLDERAALLPREARAEALVNRVPSMQLVLTNSTEHNFKAVRIEVAITGDVWAYRSEAAARPTLPAPPHEWGTPGLPSSFDFISSMSLPPVAGTPGPYIDNSNSTRIEFEDVDLRPSERVKLDPIHLVSDAALAGAMLTAKWVTTSASASGVARGEFPIAISSEIVSPFEQYR